MAHAAQKDFFTKVKDKFPKSFSRVKVLDCGSLNVNGSLKDLFQAAEYTGVDIVAGDNVHIVSAIKDLEFPDETFDTVVSGEMLEHDETWRESLQKMYDLCKKGGLVAISCAGEGRREHGTLRSTGSGAIWGTSPEYYMNLTEEHFREVYKDEMFTEVHHEYNSDAKDQYFYGIKA